MIEEINRNLTDISQFHARHIEERLKTRSESGKQEYNDLLDYYLEQVQKEEEGKCPTIFHNVTPGKFDFVYFLLLRKNYSDVGR